MTLVLAQRIDATDLEAPMAQRIIDANLASKRIQAKCEDQLYWLHSYTIRPHGGKFYMDLVWRADKELRKQARIPLRIKALLLIRRIMGRLT